MPESGEGPVLAGGMQAWPMLVTRFIDHAARWHGGREVVSFHKRLGEERTDWAGIRREALRVSAWLKEVGIGPGDRVATLAMNGAAHIAAWYGISGIGAVCHTLNPRMSDSQLAWIAAHAGDRVLIADGEFASTTRAIAARCPAIERIALLSSAEEQIGDDLLKALLPAEVSENLWGALNEESAAGLCYTSGTTGNPKGVLYSHRSNVLHTLMTIQPDVFGLSARDTVLPIVPLYHANAWGLVFSAPAVGAKLVLPGATLDGPVLADRMEQEGVTFAAGVPTAWMGLLDHLEATGRRLGQLRAVIGGAAPSEAMLRRFDAIGIPVVHAWGMTELSPVGSLSSPLPDSAQLPPDGAMQLRLKQGRVPFGVDMRIIDEHGRRLAHDGRSQGALQVRGPAVARRYFGHREDALVRDGFFDTGDIATIDPAGYAKITDRAKDVIKSGGEWISSIELENAACSCPGVAMAAALGVPDEKWGERPILIVTLSNPDATSVEAIRDGLREVLPRWWLPDRILILSDLPKGPTGKISKERLRAAVALL